MADNLFNPDPYPQQGGDMARVGGMSYACEQRARIGARISDLRIGNRRIEAQKRCKVTGWAPVADGGYAGYGLTTWSATSFRACSSRPTVCFEMKLMRVIGARHQQIRRQLESPRKGAAVHQQVLAGDKAGVAAAQERTGGADIQRYAYGKIYNAKAYSLCSQMPRFGHFRALTEQQMKDLTALLMDPASPVNQ